MGRRGLGTEVDKEALYNHLLGLPPGKVGEPEPIRDVVNTAVGTVTIR